MLLSPVGLSLNQIDTPALLLDLDAFEANTAKMAEHFRTRHVQWRPHAKAFKSPAIAHKLLKAGAIGVTVAKVSEAEVMAAGGIKDILIAHLVVGPSKVARLAALQRQADVKVTVDHPDHLAPLGEAASRFGTTIGVLVDFDIGLGRTGVRSLDGAKQLVEDITHTPGLRFDGLMGYEGHTLAIADPLDKRQAIAHAIGRLVQLRRTIEQAGFPCRIVSAGGSGSYQFTADLPGVTEIQAGGALFLCMYYSEVCGVVGHQRALTVLSTVVSRPSPDRAILDAGHKALSEFKTTPLVQGMPGCEVLGLSAEHATIGLSGSSELSIGQKVQLIPGYSDFTFVLHDRIIAHRQGLVEAVWPILGRGMMQ
jgi:D-serine deaminase-like pyridoxal phosphate-dependent protein